MTSESIRANGERWRNPHISPSKLSVWLKCTAAFDFHYIRRLPRKNKVFFPQGTAVHLGVELLNQDLHAGRKTDFDYYVLKMEEVWNEEIEREENSTTRRTTPSPLRNTNTTSTKSSVGSKYISTLRLLVRFLTSTQHLSRKQNST